MKPMFWHKFLNVCLLAVLLASCAPAPAIGDRMTQTALASVSKTATAVPPSATSAVTPSATGTAPVPPTLSPTPPPQGNIEPFASAPECVDHDGDGHADVTDSREYGLHPDDRLRHDLWNEAQGCHYDHTHELVYNSTTHIFGALNTVSYPWMTPGENNEMGHSGNTIVEKAGIQPSQSGFGDGNYIPAFRIQYHDAGGNVHMVKRFHSFYTEVQVESRDGSVVGTVSTGGWADFRCLHVPYKTFIVQLPGIDPPGVCDGSDPNINPNNPPYRAASTLLELANIKKALEKGLFLDNKWIWNSRNAEESSVVVTEWAFRTLDSWTAMDPNDVYTDHFVCDLHSTAPCKHNNSEHHVFTVLVTVPESLDFDGDGIVNYDGYTDRYGALVEGCTAPGLDCVPLKIVNAPVGLAYWRLLGGPRTTGDVICDHDIYFTSSGEYAGQRCDNMDNSGLIPSGWIEFPGH